MFLSPTTPTLVEWSVILFFFHILLPIRGEIFKIGKLVLLYCPVTYNKTNMKKNRDKIAIFLKKKKIDIFFLPYRPTLNF